MPRAVTSALQTELSKTVTRIGYLIEFVGLSEAIRWCDVGTVTWLSNVFTPYKFEIKGLGDSADRQGDPALVVQNLDSAAAAIFLAADMSAVKLNVWQVAPAAVSDADPKKLGTFMFGDMDVGLGSMSLPLVNEIMLDAFSPRRRVDPANGFSYALPAKSQIAWENEIFIVEKADG